MALLQQHKAGVTPNEAGPTGDEHAPAHVFNRADLLILDQLDDQQLRLKSGSSLPLQVGMSLTVNIKLRKVSYLQLLLGEFQDKAESLQRL